MVTRALSVHAASLAHEVMRCNADLDRLNTARFAEPNHEAGAAEPKRQPIFCRALHERWRLILGLRIGGLTLALSGRAMSAAARRGRTIYKATRALAARTRWCSADRSNALLGVSCKKAPPLGDKIRINYYLAAGADRVGTLRGDLKEFGGRR